jgi:hypothetical protein
MPTALSLTEGINEAKHLVVPAPSALSFSHPKEGPLRRAFIPIFLCALFMFLVMQKPGWAGTQDQDYQAQIDHYLSKHRNMILAGWLTLASTYVLDLAVGIPLLPVADPCPAGDDGCAMGHAIASGILAIPLAGPAAVGGIEFKTVKGGAIVYAVFLLFDSMAQIAGLTLAIVGHVKYRRAVKKLAGRNLFRPGYSKKGWLSRQLHFPPWAAVGFRFWDSFNSYNSTRYSII